MPCGSSEKFCFGSSCWLGSVNFPFRRLAGSQKLPLRIVFCELRAEAIISCVFVVETWGQIWQGTLKSVWRGTSAQPSCCHSVPWGTAYSWAQKEWLCLPVCGSMCFNNGMLPLGARSDLWPSSFRIQCLNEDIYNIHIRNCFIRSGTMLVLFIIVLQLQVHCLAYIINIYRMNELKMTRKSRFRKIKDIH